MNIEDLTIKQTRELSAIFCGGKPTVGDFWKVGDNYFIRTVTHILTGKLTGIDAHEITLTDAAWIADTGRYANAIKDGTLGEVEPYPDGVEVAVGRSSLVDATKWAHALPRLQK